MNAGRVVTTGRCAGYLALALIVVALIPMVQAFNPGLKWLGADTRDGSRTGYSDVYTPGGFSLMKNHSIKTIVMDIGISESHSTYQNYIKYATDNDMYIVIWPNQGGDYPNCGWEDPYQPNASGDYIRRVTHMLDELAGNSRVIGIVSAHEPASDNPLCNDSIPEMAAIRTQLKDYVYTKFGRRDFLVWNYFDNVADVSRITGYKSPNDIARIADVGVTWEHCFGNNEGTCPQARQKIINDANMIHNNGLDANVSLVFLFQTFSMDTSYWMPNATQLHDNACDWVNLKRADGNYALNGFMWYTWGACWYKADLFCPQQNPTYIDYSNLWPVVDTVVSTCIYENTGACTEGDWSYADGACQPGNTLTRTWTKGGSCTGGISHPATETVSCTYVAPCVDSNWNYADGSCQPTNTLTRTWTKTGTCTGGVTHPATETVSCTYTGACLESNWNYADGSCQPTNTLTRTWTKTGSCTGGVTHPGTETIACVYGTGAFSFVTFSDTHGAWSTMSPLMTRAKALNPAFGLFIGDSMDDGVNSTTLNLWTSYLGVMKNITFPVRGNHDDHFTGALTNWENYFDLTQVANKVGAANFQSMSSMPDASYSFDYGNSHFVGLDCPGDIGYCTQAEVTWLDTDLAAAEARGLTNAFLFDHGAIYAMGGTHNSCGTTKLCNKYDYYGLVAVLNKHPFFAAGLHGHEHLFGYSLIDSTRIAAVTNPFYEVIDGNGGGDNRVCDTNRCDYSASGHGFTLVKVDGSQITVEWHNNGDTAPTASVTFSNGGLVACADANWQYADGTCKPTSTLTRTWTKTGSCSGGVTHPATETISCTYVRQNEDVNNDGAIDLDDIRETVRDYGKTGNFANGYSDVTKDGAVGLKDIMAVAKKI